MSGSNGHLQPPNTFPMGPARLRADAASPSELESLSTYLSSALQA